MPGCFSLRQLASPTRLVYHQLVYHSGQQSGLQLRPSGFLNCITFADQHNPAVLAPHTGSFFHMLGIAIQCDIAVRANLEAAFAPHQQHQEGRGKPANCDTMWFGVEI